MEVNDGKGLKKRGNEIRVSSYKLRVNVARFKKVWLDSIGIKIMKKV